MLTASTLYRQALTGAHTPNVRIELWRSGVRIDPVSGAGNPGAEVPMVSGSIRATLSSQRTRTLSLTVHEDYYPWAGNDPLNPYGDELRVYRGVRFGNGRIEEFPVFRGRISRVTPPSGGTATVEANDLAVEVSRSGFTAPGNSQVGTLVRAEFKRLVQDGFPDASFGSFDVTWETVPVLTYDSDRGQALDNLAASAGAFWYTLGDGSFVLRHIPWTTDTAPVATVSDGPGGLVLRAVPVRDNTSVFNVVTVTAERTDGSAALVWTETDDDPTSPTYVLGPYGRKATTVSVQGAVNLGQLRGLARQLVRRARALTESWTVDLVADATVELGDVLTVNRTVRRSPRTPRTDARSAVQVVAGFTLPLQGSTMTLDMREQQPGAGE